MCWRQTVARSTVSVLSHAIWTKVRKQTTHVAGALGVVCRTLLLVCESSFFFFCSPLWRRVFSLRAFFQASFVCKKANGFHRIWSSCLFCTVIVRSFHFCTVIVRSFHFCTEILRLNNKLLLEKSLHLFCRRCFDGRPSVREESQCHLRPPVPSSQLACVMYVPPIVLRIGGVCVFSMNWCLTSLSLSEAPSQVQRQGCAIRSVRSSSLAQASTSWRRNAHADDFASPRDGALFFKCDITDHDTLPRGHVEAVSWWYAGSRLGVTILTFLVWSQRLPAVFLFVIAWKMDLFNRIPGLFQHNTLQVHYDPGPLFRSSRFPVWILVHALETYPFKEVCASFQRVMARAQSTATSVACATGSIASLARRSSAPLTPTPKASTEWRKTHENIREFIEFTPLPKSGIPSKVSVRHGLDRRELAHSELPSARK